MPKPEKIFKMSGVITRSTEKAIYFISSSDELWVPKSIPLNMEDLPKEGECEIEFPQWFAEEKNLG